MKSMIVLATAFFLVSAPSPDSKSISEFSAGFLIETNDIGLMASEPGSVMDSKPSSPDRPLASEPISADLFLPSAEPGSALLAEQPPEPCLAGRKNC